MSSQTLIDDQVPMGNRPPVFFEAQPLKVDPVHFIEAGSALLAAAVVAAVEFHLR